ncbi:MAG: deoxyribonuclease IV [bacterium]
MRFGLHLSISKGLLNTVAEAQRLHCDTIQIFTRSPRMWRTRSIGKKEADEFTHALKNAGIHPLVVHTPYLPNLCTSDPALYKKSLDAFKDDVRRAELLGAEFLVIHPGAYSPDKTEAEGYKNLLSALDTIFTHQTSVTILLENMAGGGRRLGGSFEKLAWIIKHAKITAHLGVCLDTSHAVGSGFDLSKKKGLDELVAAIDKTVGIEKIKLLHLNDSKTSSGSHRDRHEHIGKGYIGKQGFKNLLHHRSFKDIPAILETPKDTPRSDIQNLKMIRALSN